MEDKDVFMAELMLKVGAIQRLLIKAGMITDDDIIAEMKLISEEVMKKLKEKS